MKVSESALSGRVNEASKEENSPHFVARQWISPRVQTLPRLSELTLQSPGTIPGGGGTGGGGSTVIP